VRNVAEFSDDLSVPEFAGRRSPVQPNESAPAWSGLRESASARMTAALALGHSTASPGAIPASLGYERKGDVVGGVRRSLLAVPVGRALTAFRCRYRHRPLRSNGDDEGAVTCEL
jgi:hypothetical protein